MYYPWHWWLPKGDGMVAKRGAHWDEMIGHPFHGEQSGPGPWRFGGASAAGRTAAEPSRCDAPPVRSCMRFIGHFVLFLPGRREGRRGGVPRTAAGCWLLKSRPARTGSKQKVAEPIVIRHRDCRPRCNHLGAAADSASLDHLFFRSRTLYK